MKEESLIALYHQLYPNAVIDIVPLTQGGSDRMYYRLSAENFSPLIGAVSDNIAENECFFHLTEKMNQAQVAVPRVVAVSKSRTAYLQTDLGNLSLLDCKLKSGETDVVKSLYKKALEQLFLFQTAAGIEEEKLLHRNEFNAYWIKHDLNYFIYSFVQQTNVPIPYTIIQQEIAEWAISLARKGFPHLMYRDFQGRNVMVAADQPYLIDYQGAMRGPVMYDVASLLWQAKAKLSKDWREELLEHYIARYTHHQCDLNRSDLELQYRQYVLLRLLQVMGAYGFRGIVQNKPHFKSSIVNGLENINDYLQWYPETYIPSHFKTLLEKITKEEIIEKFR